MHDYSADETYPPGLKSQVAFYGLYVALLALGFIVGPIIWRRTLEYVFYVFMDPNLGWTQAAYMVSVVTGVILIIAGLFIAEPYLRAGARRGELVKRFVRVALPLVILGAVGYLIQVIGLALI